MSKKPVTNKTAIIRAAIDSDSSYNAVIPPIYLTSTFSYEEYGRKAEYDYTRSCNPTRDALASALKDLEGGVDAVITSSGMAAVSLPLSLLKPGDLLLAPHDCYGRTYSLLEALAEKGHFNLNFIDQTNPEVLKEAFKDKPQMILVETPSNPLLRITDIEMVVSLAKESDTIVVADNTFMAAVLQRPIEFGVDIVVHSTTKYLNGHSDVIGGAVISANEEIHEKVKWWGNAYGITGAPFDSFLTLRGVRTLFVRMEQHQKNATKVAEFLESHAAIEKVYYPGLPSHEGYELAKKQQDGPGAMLSFQLKGGEGEVRKFLAAIQLFSLAQSLGGIESLVSHPASMTHLAMAPEARKEAGIADSLLRLSIGIEDVNDLIIDLEQALASL